MSLPSLDVGSTTPDPRDADALARLLDESERAEREADEALSEVLRRVQHDLGTLVEVVSADAA